jgi:glucokinase
VATARRPTARAGDGSATAEAIADQIADLIDELGAELIGQPSAGLAGELGGGLAGEPPGKQAGEWAGPAAVGVVVPGIVDEATGTACYSANLGWQDVPFTDLLRRRFAVPVTLGHDVRAGGLAEWRLGAGRGCRNGVFLAVGTGVAAALVLNGRPYAAGGEVGHVDVGHGLPCACGATGCVETIASAAAIARRYRDRTGRAVTGADQVVTRARHGDADAAVVLGEAVDALGRAIRMMSALLAPEAVVLGGGLFQSGDAMLGPLRHWLAEHPAVCPTPELRPAALGDLAGCLGAGLLAIDLVDLVGAAGSDRAG